MPPGNEKGCEIRVLSRSDGESYSERVSTICSGSFAIFGSDASLDAVKAREVTAYLEANAAGRADKFSAPGSLRISRTPWFRKEHRDGHDGLTLAM